MPSSQQPSPAGGRRIWASLRKTLVLLVLACRSYLVGILVLAALASGLPLAAAYLGKLVVDATLVAGKVGAANMPELMASLVGALMAAELGAQLVSVLLDRLQAVLRHLAGTRLQMHISTTIIEKAIGLDLTDFERPRFYDLLSRARREGSSRPMALVTRAVTTVRGVFTVLGCALLLLAFSGWVVLLLAVSMLPGLMRETRTSDKEYRVRRDRATRWRKLGYLEHVLTTDTHAKEVKLLGLGPTLSREHANLSASIEQEEEGLARSRLLWGTLAALPNTVGFYVCYASIIIATARSHLSVGEMTMYLMICRQTQVSLFELANALAGIYDDALYVSSLFEYLDLPARKPPLRRPASREGGEPGLRLEGVGFRYPGSDSWVLRHLDLCVPPGQTLALVGRNGAGKSTLVKLVCGLYPPTEGRILLDGRDLADWDQRQLWQRMAVVLQDFSRYQLTLRDNIQLGSVGCAQQADHLQEAISRAGLQPLAERLPAGLDTHLGHWFEGGVELSGGQWQGVSLARAFMRRSADILVLDEPTAALDPEAEQALQGRIRVLARGRTCILISHRLATVKDAHAICVLEAGRALEHGRHDQLLAANGAYARLFSLQAEAYR